MRRSRSRTSRIPKTSGITSRLNQECSLKGGSRSEGAASRLLLTAINGYGSIRVALTRRAVPSSPKRSIQCSTGIETPASAMPICQI